MSALADTLRRLARSLSGLRVRFRAAAAAEAARAVGEAARELAEVAMGGPPKTTLPAVLHDPWSEPDPWADETDWADPAHDFGRDPADSPVLPRMNRAYAALAAGFAAGRWWLARRGSLPEAAGVALLSALATLACGPAADALI